YRLQGALNVVALEQSFREIVRRHESLRTIFQKDENEEAVQVILPEPDFILDVVNMEESGETSEQQQPVQIEAEAKRPFDLAAGPLFRATLYRLGEQEHGLLLNMHHIVSDGWSQGVLIQEWKTLYTAFVNQMPSPLAELSIQYADYAHWQREWLQGEALQEQLTYWKTQLGGELPILELPYDHPRAAVQRYEGDTERFTLSPALTKKLTQLSQQTGSTLFMTLLAAFQTFMMRYSGQEDVIVGTPIANRTQAETEKLIGFFVNTLALRTNLEGNPSFNELLERVREVTLGAYGHQDIPFEKLVEELQPERDQSRSPLFQVMFVLQNAPEEKLELPGVQVHVEGVNTREAKFDLTLSMAESEQGLIGAMNYNTGLFDAATIARMV
ncbi:condensation domain-containing protein, partial [Chengkuizengella marina]